MDRATQIVLSPLAENLLRQPLDYMQADHHRLDKACELLDQIRGDPQSLESRGNAQTVLAYLAVDLRRHIADEEDLFGHLAKSCLESDKVESLIGMLRAEHHASETLLDKMLEALSSLEAEGTIDGLDPLIGQFAETKRQHIRAENERLLPLARTRLDDGKLRALGKSMALRRGVPFPG